MEVFILKGVTGENFRGFVLFAEQIYGFWRGGKSRITRTKPKTQVSKTETWVTLRLGQMEKFGARSHLD